MTGVQTCALPISFCSIIAENLEKDKDEETNDDSDDGIDRTDGIPKLTYNNDPDITTINIGAIQLLEYLEKCNSPFSPKTVLMIGEQLIGRLKALHDRSGLIHTNKSINIMFGALVHNKHKVFLIDSGFLNIISIAILNNICLKYMSSAVSEPYLLFTKHTLELLPKP